MSHAHARMIALILGSAAGLAAGGPAAAQPTEAPRTLPAAAARSPFLGRWELDLTRMPATYGTPPKRVVYAFEEAGAGLTRMTVDITAPDGSVRHMAVRYRGDGTAAPGEGDTGEADSAAFNAPAGNVLVMSLAKDRHLGSVRVYAVSADGAAMTELAANVDGEGVPFVRNFHYRRIANR